MTTDLFANLKSTPFWKEDAPKPDLPMSPLPEQADVVIVGGGYTGLAAARTLAKVGTKAVVLEQGEIGAGASAINGGQVAPGLKSGPKSLFKTYGRELGFELWQASFNSVAYLEQLLAEEKIECDYTAAGGLALAHKPSHYKGLIEDVEWMARELNFEQKIVPPEKLRQEIGTDIFHGAAIEAEGGGVQPAKYLYGLAQATARVGAMLCEQTTAQRIERQTGKDTFQVTTNQGVVKTSRVLIATNGYTSDLVPGIQRRVFPVGSYMITTEPLPAALQQELSPRDRVFYDTKWFLNYFRLTPDGRMSMGGRNNLSPNLDVKESARLQRERMVEIFPQLKDVSITHTWTGRLGITFDLIPHIGQVDGIYYALGYGGHGVALAGYLGKEAAELMCGLIPRSPFAEVPHQTYFFYRKNPWFLPFAAAYYRFLDAIS